jgi:hypothetical protein
MSLRYVTANLTRLPNQTTIPNGIIRDDVGVTLSRILATVAILIFTSCLTINPTCFIPFITLSRVWPITVVLPNLITFTRYQQSTVLNRTRLTFVEVTVGHREVTIKLG